MPPNFDPDNIEPSGDIDLFVPDFKPPQVWKLNVGVDHKLPFGIVASAEYIYTNTIQNIFVQNLNLRQPIANLVGTDNRNLFDRDNEVDSRFNRIHLVSNTNEGFAHNVVAQLGKTFDFGLSTNFSYSWGASQGLNQGTSSTISSLWRNQFNTIGLNFQDLEGNERNNFSADHIVRWTTSFRKEYLGFMASTISLFYTGQSGRRVSYTYNDNGQLTDQDTREFSLIYVPQDASEINLIDITDRDGNVVATAQDQWEALNNFIEQDDHLRERRGQFAERNGSNINPWTHIVDLRFLQDFYLDLGNGKRNTLQVSVDVFNFTAAFGSLINKRFGRIRRTGTSFDLLNFEGFENGNREPVADPNNEGLNVPQFTLSSVILDGEAPFANNFDDNGFRSSRWQMQIGLRYIFGN